GLTFGVRDIEVVVNPEVTRVELRLDGEAQAVLDGPPWRTTLDFGAELTPHTLDAIAFDAAGRRIGTAQQWINLPRQQAEARLALLADEAGRPNALRLSWESLSGRPPERIEVAFDGEPLVVRDTDRVELPAHDPETIHFVTVEITFPDGIRARAEATFGGVYGTEVYTELTAVPVMLDRGIRLPKTIDGMADWLTVDGRPVRVVAAEEGPADVVVVRDRGLEPLLAELRAEGAREPAIDRRRPRSRIRPNRLQFAHQLGRDDNVLFLWPTMARLAHPRYNEVGVFDRSPTLDADDGGLYWFLTRLYPPGGTARGVQFIADAVAVAGRRAAAANHRRAVLLFLGRDPDDASQRQAAQVRSYLASLRVPLVVWGSRRLAGDHPAAAWGEIERVTSISQLGDAVDDLRRSLARQRILWVEGRHLPQVIELAEPAPRGVSLLR
ncbi:MAG: hypothetical protein AAGE94_25380, partial [Acidobacteriota bacterium]